MSARSSKNVIRDSGFVIRSDVGESRVTSHESLVLASRVTRHASRLFMAMMIASTFVHADALIDPTRPPMTVKKPGLARAIEADVRVTAIFRTAERCVAVIDGKVVQAGDRVGDITVQEINADGVRYVRAGRVEFARLPKQAATVRHQAAGLEEGQ